MNDARHERWTVAAIAIALLAAVAAAYAPALGNDFVSYDDPDYVLENPAVRAGLTWEGVRWAFTSAHASNWHPLTWLAHMLDVQLFGLDPRWHHASSVALHGLGSVLCYLSLRALTARTWLAAGTAFLFALHPLRVESVAWVSERKDVLSGVLFFATLLAHARYARAPGAGRYALVLLAAVLGLLAKPMLVSLPCVLLLLDLWPLERLPTRGLGRLVLEKLPLVALVVASALVTVHAQRAGGSLYTLDVLPLGVRLANAPLSLARYLGHFLWPADLAYFYPHRALVAGQASGWSVPVFLALALLAALSIGALAGARRRPALAVGWLWCLGMLVPVLGLVQVGEQALADRYAYLPLVGVQLSLVWLLCELGRARPALARPLALGFAGVLVACGVASARQARTWRDSETLQRHAIAVTEGNYPAWTGLANELARAGDVPGARAAYEQALVFRPSYAPALYGLGLLEQEHGDAERALALYRAACEALPGFAAARLNLGSLLAARGDRGAAAEAFEEVLALFPEHPDAHFDLALLLLQAGELRAALPGLEAAVRARPGFSAAWEKLGEVHELLGEHAEALAALAQAVRDPARVTAAQLAAWILATAAEPELRDPPRALELARRAVLASARREPRALESLAAALAASGELGRACEVQEEALRLLSPAQQGAAKERLERYRRGESFTHTH
jgi:protein O-mannosyl-transferase